MSRKTEVNFKEQMKDGQIIAPTIYDCLVGRMAENSGFKTFVVNANSVAMTYGMSDLGLLTADDMLFAVRRIADFLPYPVIADYANGLSESISGVYHNLGRLKNSGAQAVIIDDSSYIEGQNLVSKELLLAKVKAAKEVLKDTNIDIIVATNALNDYGINECFERLNSTKELGIKYVMVRNLKEMKDVEFIGKNINGVKLLDSFNSKESNIDINESYGYGYKIALVNYLDKASLYGMMHFGLKTSEDNHTVYTDYHDFDGYLPNLIHQQLLSNQWKDLEKEINVDLLTLLKGEN